MFESIFKKIIVDEVCPLYSNKSYNRIDGDINKVTQIKMWRHNSKNFNGVLFVDAALNRELGGTFRDF